MFIPSGVDGHFGCFSFLAVMNNAAIKWVTIIVYKLCFTKTEIKTKPATSLVVQWLRLHTSNAGGVDPWLWNGDLTCQVAQPKKKKQAEQNDCVYRPI